MLKRLLHVNCTISGHSNSHHGYCSDNECGYEEYNSFQITFIMEINSAIYDKLIR